MILLFVGGGPDRTTTLGVFYTTGGSKTDSVNTNSLTIGSLHEQLDYHYTEDKHGSGVAGLLGGGSWYDSAAQLGIHTNNNDPHTTVENQAYAPNIGSLH